MHKTYSMVASILWDARFNH